MNLKQIHHVAIIVSDYERSKDFYVNKLGFQIVREVYRQERRDYKLDLQLHGCELEIFGIDTAPQRPSYPEACGLRHLAFWVEDIEQTIEELGKLGIETEPVRMDPYSQRRMTFFHDPDGLPLELHE